MIDGGDGGAKSGASFTCPLCDDVEVIMKPVKDWIDDSKGSFL